MTSDNILYSTTKMRNAVSGLKKKLSNLKISIEQFDADLAKIDDRFEDLITQAEIYKAKLERELGREVRRLEKELQDLAKIRDKEPELPQNSERDLRVAATVGVLESILCLISENASDFRLISQSFLFPAVIDRVMSGKDEAYYLDEVPTSASVAVERGREYVKWLRSEYDTHLTENDTWQNASEYVVDWWRNDALPLLYGSRDDQWDIDVPLSLQEMLTWRDSPGDRPMMLPSVFDAYEVYRKHKDKIYESSGLRQFDLKQFTFPKQ